MNNLVLKKVILLAIITVLAIPSGEAQPSGRRSDRAMFGKTLKTKQKKIKELPSIRRAKAKQEANKKKLDKEFKEYVKASRKRAVKIQTPEVQERMIQNRKDANRQANERKKRRAENFRRAGMKF